jgi:hypothetical protein
MQDKETRLATLNYTMFLGEEHSEMLVEPVPNVDERKERCVSYYELYLRFADKVIWNIVSTRGPDLCINPTRRECDSSVTSSKRKGQILADFILHS